MPNVSGYPLPQRRLALGLAALALSACAVGPDYVQPATPTPPALTRELLPTAGTGGPVARTWWKAFDSGELDHLVEQALAHSPTLEAAEATLAAARQNVIAQRGYFFPTVQAGYNTTRQNVGQTVSAPLNNGEAIYNYHTAQLSIAYAPDIFGGNRRQVEGLQAAAEGQRFQLEAARLTLSSNLVGAALQAAMLEEQVALTDQAVTAMQEQLRYMRKLQRSGYASGIDVATQENLLTQAQQNLAPLQKQLEQTRNLIAVLGAGLLQPVFVGGTLAARQRAAEAEFRTASAQYRGTVLGAFQNVADTLYALDIDTRALRTAQASETATRTGYELTQSQLRHGYASQPAVLAAQQAWLQASAARVAAQGALLGDTVALFQALGGGVLNPESTVKTR